MCYRVIFNPLIYQDGDARGGFSAEYEDREEGGKAKGKDGAHGVRGRVARGARCKTKEAWPRH